MNPEKTLLIVSGESSGELYGALLAGELKKKLPDISIFGVGGERMRAAGVEVFREVSHAFGGTEALRALKELKKTFDQVLRKTDELRPPLAVLIDFPDFNFKLALELKKRGIKILYYVSPQVWAWRAKRIKKMAGFVDRIALVLPFEEDLYMKEGIPCEFVGHPIMDEICGMAEANKSALGLDSMRPVLSILPGSRPSELAKLLPVLIETVPLLKKEFPQFQYFVPLAPNLKIGIFEKEFSELRSLGVVVKKESALKALSVSEAAVIASGTATLQSALLGTPFVVIYKLSPLTFFIGRMLVKVKYVTLLNILLDKEVARELLQKDVTPENILAELKKILSQKNYSQQIKSELSKVRAMFEGKRASQRVAEMAMEMAGWGP